MSEVLNWCRYAKEAGNSEGYPIGTIINYSYNRTQSPDPMHASQDPSKSPSYANKQSPSSASSPCNGSAQAQPGGSPKRARNHSPNFYENHDDNSSDSDLTPHCHDDPARCHRSSASPNAFDQTSNSSIDSSPKLESANFWNDASCTLPEAPEVVLCFWCKQVCDRHLHQSDVEGSIPYTNGDRSFCSEVCFSQSRRASFKKSKVCDWCRQAKATVSYVDFTDGTHQLQFCSNKCLNQYKMQIFCRETEAHLQLHPHLSDLKSAQGDALITPDLWLKDCSDTKILVNKRVMRRTSQSNEDIEKTLLNESSLQRELPSDGIKIASSLPGQYSPSSSSSSPTNFDMHHEPMNLTTQNKEYYPVQDAYERKTLLPQKIEKQRTSLEEMKLRAHLTRSDNSKNRRKDHSPLQQECAKQQKGFALISPANSGESEIKSKGAIRVKQLAEMPQRHCLDLPHVSPPVSTSTSLPGIPNLGLFIGNHLPLMSGIPPLLQAPPRPPPPAPPPQAPPEMTRPPFLPPLLLSHPELWNFHRPRPPLLLPQTTPLQLGPKPLSGPMQPSPSYSQPQPSQELPSQPITNIPPVTVLLPLPIPIPIPIPIPFPIPKNFMYDPTPTKVDNTAEKQTPTAEQMDKNNCTMESEQHVNTHRVIQGSIYDANTDYIPACQSSSCDAAFQSDKAGEKLSRELDKQTVPSAAFEGSRSERKERSILKYTSDIYEINGTIIPNVTHGAHSQEKESSNIEDDNQNHCRVNSPVGASFCPKRPHDGSHPKKKRNNSEKSLQTKNKTKNNNFS